jgi:DNA polymerase III delta prime subunit
MHAYLLIGNSEKEIDDEIAAICKKDDYSPLNFEIKKIGDVRELIRFTTLKLSQKTLVIIKNVHEATVEAQNAFLKILEEPQSLLAFALTAPNADMVIATINSRCQIINTLKDQEINKEDIKAAKEFFESGAEEKLALTSKIKGREEAREFVLKLIKGGHKLLGKQPELAPKIEIVLKTLENINVNANIQLQLTNMIIKMA